MSSIGVSTALLITGDRMDRAEFLRRWEALPDIKNAELIEGIVFVPSPVSLDHGKRHNRINWWLTQYADATPGCQCGDNVTWLMLESAPQPDAFLRIRPEYGGQSRDEARYPAGAPELAVEICLTSTEVDFGPKLVLYQHAGVQEYVTLELLRRRVVWRALEKGSYIAIPRDPDGIVRSRVFPGLWLDVEGFWQDDGEKVGAALRSGLSTAEHQDFTARLQARI